jgi:hypothetical protein
MAVVSGFLIYVGITTALDTQPVILIPTFLGLIVGVFLSVHVPDNNIGLVVLVGALSLTLLLANPFVQEWAVDNDSPVIAVVASIMAPIAWGSISTTLLVLLPIWFPDGVAVTNWSRWTARAAVALSGIAIIGAMFSERVCVDPQTETCGRYEINPWGIPGIDGSAFEILFVGVFLLAVPAIVSMVLRWRRSTGVEREQLKWFAFATALFVVAFILIGTNESLIGGDVADISSAAALSGVWLSIGLAVTRYRLYAIDKVISRTLAYTLIVVFLGAVYFGMVTLTSYLLPAPNDIAVAGSTLAVAAMFNPVRRRIQRAVDRRFNRSGYEGGRIAEQFTAELQDSLTVEELTIIWKRTVDNALHPRSSGVWLSHPMDNPHTDEARR